MQVYSSWLHCVRDSYKKEGLKAFTRGLSATLSRAFVVNSSLFLAYEALLGHLTRML